MDRERREREAAQRERDELKDAQQILDDVLNVAKPDSAAQRALGEGERESQGRPVDLDNVGELPRIALQGVSSGSGHQQGGLPLPRIAFPADPSTCAAPKKREGGRPR